MLFLYPFEIFELKHFINSSYFVWNSPELFINDNLFLEELTISTINFTNWLVSWNFYLYSNVLALNKFQLVTSTINTLNLYQLLIQPFSYSIWIETNYTTILIIPSCW